MMPPNTTITTPAANTRKIPSASACEIVASTEYGQICIALFNNATALTFANLINSNADVDDC